MNENLPIDPSQLDEEWLQQPLLFDEAQESAADCLKERDELKEDLATLEAETGKEIRDNPDKHGFAKAPTVQAVFDLVLLNNDVIGTKRQLIEASHKLNLANNTVKSFEMRRKALEKLCDLHISNYFSVPNPNHMLDGGKRFIEAKNKKVEQGQNEAVNKLNEKKKSRKVTKDNSKISDAGVKASRDKALESEATKEPRQRRSRRK